MYGEEGLIAIRSYRVCFQLERRIHKIDQWRVPLSYGVPLSGVGWALGTLGLMLVLSGLPVLGAVLHLVHPAFRLVMLPIAVAWAMSRWRIDGRPPSAAGRAWLRWRTGPRRLVAFRPAPAAAGSLGAITFAPDERGARLRPAVVRGPARVVLRYPAQLRERGDVLHVIGQEGAPLWTGTEVRLKRGQRLVVAR